MCCFSYLSFTLYKLSNSCLFIVVYQAIVLKSDEEFPNVTKIIGLFDSLLKPLRIIGVNYGKSS